MHLLDTHTLLWALTDPGRLGPQAREVVVDPGTQLLASTVSAWEIATKHRLGRLPQAEVLVGAYAQHLDRLGVVRLPVAEAHALLAGALDWTHRDPFDRMLAAQAMTESVTLVTADRVFADLGGLRLLW